MNKRFFTLSILISIISYAQSFGVLVSSFPDLSNSKVALIDFDVDGDIDFFVTGVRSTPGEENVYVNKVAIHLPVVLLTFSIYILLR